jgi:hypothetical protein
MKKEYDFSKGERGKFYNKDAKFNLPIYLSDDTMSFIETIAKKRKTDISTVVNELIKREMNIIEYADR